MYTYGYAWQLTMSLCTGCRYLYHASVRLPSRNSHGRTISGVWQAASSCSWRLPTPSPEPCPRPEGTASCRNASSVHLLALRKRGQEAPHRPKRGRWPSSLRLPFATAASSNPLAGYIHRALSCPLYTRFESKIDTGAGNCRLFKVIFGRWRREDALFFACVMYLWVKMILLMQ